MPGAVCSDASTLARQTLRREADLGVKSGWLAAEGPHSRESPSEAREWPKSTGTW